MKQFNILVFFMLFTLFSKAQFYGNNFFIFPDATLYVNGNVTTGDFSRIEGKLILSGSLQNGGVIDGGDGTLHLFGNTQQDITGSGFAIGHLIVQNTSGGINILNNRLFVVRSSSFLNGIVKTDNSNLIGYNQISRDFVGAPTDQSHINGPVLYNGQGTFIYPVGNGSIYRPVTVDLSDGSGGLVAQYHLLGGSSLPPGTPSTILNPLKSVSKFEYWNITPITTATGTVTLNWDVSKVPNGILSSLGVSALRVAHHTASGWVSEGGTATGVFNTTGSITSNTITTWSPFALGSIDPLVAPLPLRFLNVSAKLNQDASRLVQWQVVLETNVLSYTVQVSTNGVDYTDAGTVTATGVAATQDYFFTDRMQTSASKLYYRIKSTDNDGKINFSQIVSVNLNNSMKLQVYPNPVADHYVLSFGSNMRGDYMIDIISANGALVSRTENISVAGAQSISFNRPSKLIAGTYLLRITRKDDGYTQSFKLIFQ